MDILNLSVRQIVEKIKNAEITSVELCKLYIERIKKFEKDIVEKIKSERPEIIDSIESSGKLEENTEKLLSQIIEEHKKGNK